MAVPIKLHRLSKYADLSEVLQWLRSPGDVVKEGESLVEVLSDKATVEITSPASGSLLQIVVPAGSEVPAGTTLAWVGQPGEQPGETEPVAQRDLQATPPIDDGADRDAAVRPAVASRGPVKAVPAARRLATEHRVPLESLVGSGPGGIVTVADVEKGIAKHSAKVAQESETDSRAPDRPRRPRISPVARRLAKEHGLDITQVQGSGPAGTITKTDIQRLLDLQRAESLQALQLVTTPGAGTGERETTVLPLKGIQRSMSERMTISHQTIVQATTVADVDMTAIAELRKRIPASYTAFVVKAAANAVTEYPLINSSLEDDSIVIKKHVDMGVAVAAKEGLMVPVLRHAEGKSLAQIHGEVEDLASRARSRALKSSELLGPTMTVTNSGAFGSLLFTPIIVLPQSATLGMGKVAPTPVVREGQIVVRSIMYLCLSYDHRFLDGAVAVRYLQRVRALLEDPISLLWDGDLRTEQER